MTLVDRDELIAERDRLRLKVARLEGVVEGMREVLGSPLFVRAGQIRSPDVKVPVVEPPPRLLGDRVLPAICGTPMIESQRLRSSGPPSTCTRYSGHSGAHSSSPLHLPCPTCGASAGVACKNSPPCVMGDYDAEFHAERR